MSRVGHNYGNKVPCPLCKSKQGDTQEHLFNCFYMKMNSNIIFHMRDEKYQDIFSQNDKKLIQISKICESACMTRKRLINSNANI